MIDHSRRRPTPRRCPPPARPPHPTSAPFRSRSHPPRPGAGCQALEIDPRGSEPWRTLGRQKHGPVPARRQRGNGSHPAPHGQRSRTTINTTGRVDGNSPSCLARNEPKTGGVTANGDRTSRETRLRCLQSVHDLIEHPAERVDDVVVPEPQDDESLRPQPPVPLLIVRAPMMRPIDLDNDPRSKHAKSTM